MEIMRAQFNDQGPAGILKARRVEDRLMRETWHDATYDLLPALRRLTTPTLVIAGDHDFIPIAVAEAIANALPNAKLVTMEDCGHFAYLECPEATRKAIEEFLRPASK